ncbi:hypothetical protein E4U19_002964 [Claviceps sp. Clav32 group G5]|nr:hypothetical protein E4U19_002964 [Claviceps sp. Clav32 group G5]KAG6041495.1 hypothetical protein E4U39_006527 [Claviceps sp. Clav50 group G5]
MYDKTVSLGSRLHYPITVSKLLKSPGDFVKKQETIFEYKFTWRRRVDDDEWVDETTYTEFDSPAEGTLKEWRIKEGSSISADVPCMLIEEACGHEVQIQGLCSLCGADMTEVNWASEEKDTDRAMINMTHDQTGLMVSESVATKAELDTQKRLLEQRKLNLVVDLDQTIIHACIEPTIGDWQRDTSNPNHEAVKDVRSFQLEHDASRGWATNYIYYVKMRPGLQEFLEEVSQMYELHVYTMGTRAYAQQIARLVDPDGKFFGNRVISRDESGSMEIKSLQRLFPVSTNMVVIIDDRSDVWPRNRPNLIKVVPYDFFKGIGDINSSFLPKRTDLLPAPTQANGPPLATNKSSSDRSPITNEKISPLESLAEMSGAGDEASLKLQTKEQEKTLEKQLMDRPLLHMQEELDKKEELSGETKATEESFHHRRHQLLSDDDEELIALQDHLTDLHSSFYDLYDRRRKGRQQGKSIQPPSHGQAQRKASVDDVDDDDVDLSMVPDAGDILDELKSNVLSGLVIVFSGLVPQGQKVEESEYGMQAQSFGAQVLNDISRRVTHLVVSLDRPRTKKVRQAAIYPNVKIVNHKWFADCISQWRRLDERPYYLNISADLGRSEDMTEPASVFEAGIQVEARVHTEDETAAEPEGAPNLPNSDWTLADKDLEELLGTDIDDDSEDEDEDEGEDKVGKGDEKEDEHKDKDKDEEEGESAGEDLWEQGQAELNQIIDDSIAEESAANVREIPDGSEDTSKKRKQPVEDEKHTLAEENIEDDDDESVIAKKQRMTQ